VSNRSRVFALAPAKINLCLHVGDRRADGYHDLESLVAFAAIGDVITIEPDDQFLLTVDGPFAGVLGASEDNLALRAAQLLATEARIGSGARIHLTKNLPVASGIGGGSADAAAALRALVRLWKIGLPGGALRKIAASLGADVPICLDSTPAWMEGKGERITPLPSLPPVHLLLANPGVPVPTGQVFAALRERRGVGLGRPNGFGDVAELIQFLRTTTNDLERSARAIAPEVADVLEAMAVLPGAMFVRMSGSGATCFGIFASDAEVIKGAELLATRHPEWWVRPTTLAPKDLAAPVIQ
jgi:4-diphosphocytidyl-2-C-methyl-D-erythritol kinase